MHKLLIAADPITNEFARLALKGEGHKVSYANDVAQAFCIALQEPPSLIIANADVTVSDDISLVETLMAHPTTAAVPCIVITSDARKLDPQVAKHGKLVLTRPVRREQIYDAINVTLAQNFPELSATREMGTPELEPDLSPTDDTITTRDVPSATVLCIEAVQFPVYAKKLNAQEMGELVKLFSHRASLIIERSGGWLPSHPGLRIEAVFEESPSHQDPHEERAAKAAMVLIKDAIRFREWVQQRFAQHQLPDWALIATLSSGPVQVVTQSTGQEVSGVAWQQSKDMLVQARKTRSTLVATAEVANANDRFLKTPRGTDEWFDIVALEPRKGADTKAVLFYQDLADALLANTSTLQSFTASISMIRKSAA